MSNDESTILNCPFLLECDKKWENMSLVEVSSNGGEVRFCSGCKKNVYHCTSVTQFLEHQNLNNCIMLDRSNGSFVERTLGKPVPNLELRSVMPSEEDIPFLKPINKEKKAKKSFVSKILNIFKRK